jgi:hypothetical protein
MKLNPAQPRIWLFTGMATLATLFMGCETIAESENQMDADDGQSAFITNEVDQMGQSLSGLSDGSLAKAGSSLADTITGEKIVERFGFVEACECFVRKASYTNSNGYERVRMDSVTLLDSSGAILSKWDRSLIAKLVHKRHITRNKGSHDIDVHINTEATFKTIMEFWWAFGMAPCLAALTVTPSNRRLSKMSHVNG